MADKEERRTDPDGFRFGAFTAQDLDTINTAIPEGTTHFEKVACPFPEFAAFELDRDVKMHIPCVHNGRRATANITAHQGVYFLDVTDREGGVKHKGGRTWLYAASFTMEESEGVKARIIDGGVALSDGDIKGRAELRPLKTSFRPEPLGLTELAAHARIQDLREAGEDAAADEVLHSLYHFEGGITEESIDVDATEGEPPTFQDLQPVTEFMQGLSKLSNPKSWLNMEKTGGKNLDVRGEHEKTPATVLVRLADEDEETRKKALFKGTEEAAYCGAASLWNAQRRNFTSADVARIAYSTDNPSKTQIAKVDKQLEDMAGRRVTLDWTAEARRRKLMFEGEEVKTFKHTGYLLALEGCEITTANRKTVKGWKFLAPPILYRHDQETGQITSYDAAKLKEATKGISATERNTLVKSYLLRRIGRIKHGGTTREIRYESVMAAAHVDNDPKGKGKAAVKKAVTAYLEGFARVGIIEGFEEYRAKKETGRGTTGVRIDVKKKN